jgi:hypothetical protein
MDGVKITDMRAMVLMLIALMGGCARKPAPAFDIVAAAKADGLQEPLDVDFRTLWNYYADHPQAAQRMVEGCKLSTAPADDPARALCGAALLGMNGQHYDGRHGRAPAAAMTPRRMNGALGSSPFSSAWAIRVSTYFSTTSIQIRPAFS